MRIAEQPRAGRHVVKRVDHGDPPHPPYRDATRQRQGTRGRWTSRVARGAPRSRCRSLVKDGDRRRSSSSVTLTPMPKPLLLLDVDGVISPLGPGCGEEIVEAPGDEFPVTFS